MEDQGAPRGLDRRSVLRAGAGALVVLASRGAEAASEPLIGYTEYRTNLPGGRHPNVATMRAVTVRADGTSRRPLAESLCKEPDTWTQFAGWSPDGETAILGSGWQSPENAREEEKAQSFRFTPEGWRLDIVLFDLKSKRLTNLTAVERVSFYNSGLFFWPGKPNQLGFQALVDGNSHPFAMDRDGRNKRDLTGASKEFAYGFSSSPDGKRIAYHQSYQIYIADADGSNARRVETGNPFNFVPQWSADGEWLLFVSGEHYRCHPHLVRKDGSGLRKLADRGTYRGVVEFLDVPDFHGGSSDISAWARDGRSVFYTSQVGEAVELMRVDLDGKSQQLTTSPAGTLHYHPTPSPDGRRLLYGSRRGGRRQLYVARTDGTGERVITTVGEGYGAMWAHWQPGTP
ncbi:MAG: translocation protein TolB [Armatimonadetes bacterium]|jgi:Tol biopolymer transport system component|nr:translocation protein TolB [Armatimonadota bacterium]